MAPLMMEAVPSGLDLIDLVCFHFQSHENKPAAVSISSPTMVDKQTRQARQSRQEAQFGCRRTAESVVDLSTLACDIDCT